MQWQFPARRRPAPTRRLMWAGSTLLGVALLAPWFPALAWVLGTGGFLLSLLVALEVFGRPPLAAVGVRRQPPRLHHVGRRGSYTIHVSNAGADPLVVALRDVLPAGLEGAVREAELTLAPGEEAALERSFTSLQRGDQQLLPIGVSVAYRSALLTWQSVLDLADTLAVAPGRPAGETDWLLARASLMEESGEKKGRLTRASWEFESLRDYVLGDEVRRIDWKASARRCQPMVRQYQIEHNAEVIVALDCGRLMGNLIHGISKLDLAMTPVLDLAAVALRRGDRVGLLAFDSAPRVYLPPRPGLGQLDVMIRSLAHLSTRGEPTSYLRAVAHLESRHRRRCLLIVFTDFTDELSAREMYANLGALCRRHLMVLVGVSDPHLEEIFDSSAQDTRSVLERSVAGQLLLERRQVLARVERLGALTLDAEPRQLTAPLIRKYLEARLGGLL